MPDADTQIRDSLEHCRRGQLDEAERELDEAAQAGAAAEVLAACRTLLRWRRAVLAGHNTEGLGAAVEALQRLADAGWASQLGWCYGALGFSIALAGDLGAALRYVERGIADAETRGDPVLLADRLSNQAGVLALSGQREQAITIYRQCLAMLPDDDAAAATRALLLNNIAYSHLLLARADSEQREALARQALQAATQALQAQPAAPPYRQAWALSNQGAALTLLGRFEEAEQRFLAATPLAGGHARVRMALSTHHVRLLVELNRCDEARRLLQGLDDLAVTEQLFDPGVDEWLDARLTLEVHDARAEAALHWAAQRVLRLEARHRLQLATLRELIELFHRLEREQLAERERVQQQLRFWQDEALRDPLSGTLNRRGLQAALAQAQPPERGWALILLDLDHFKQINDRYGHPIGDRVLVEAARLMQATLRERDLLARVGGEEFCVLLRDCELEQAAQVAEKLRRRIADADWTTLAAELRVTVSGGLSAAGREARFDELVAVADARLYQAKAGGRNRIC